jgi:SiaC family regulatory phosphoprotein
MNDLMIEGTKTRPYIKFDAKTALLEIGGESYPENAMEFYKPIYDWLDLYLLKNAEREIIFTFKMIYFNTSSSKAILDILDRLETHNTSGGLIKLIWLFEEDDEDIEESGEEFIDGLTLNYVIESYHD